MAGVVMVALLMAAHDLDHFGAVLSQALPKD